MKQKIISSALLVVGFVAGATALSAVAGTWTAPGTGYPAGTDCRPPNCNVDAPLNVGAIAQTKVGELALGEKWNAVWGTQPNIYAPTGYFTSLAVNNLVVATGTPGIGKVLVDTSGTGIVGWGNVSGGSAVENYDIECIPYSAVITYQSYYGEFCFRLNKQTGGLEVKYGRAQNDTKTTAYDFNWNSPVSVPISMSGSGPYSLSVSDIATVDSYDTQICIYDSLGTSKCMIGKRSSIPATNINGITTWEYWSDMTNPY